jgi:hypothetical protein
MIRTLRLVLPCLLVAHAALAGEGHRYVGQNPDWWIVVATAVLAVFTWKLWRETKEAVTETALGLAATQQSAAASQRMADVAERSLNGLERPYVFITQTRSETQASELQITYTIRNCGRTPGIVLEYGATLFGAVECRTFPQIPPDRTEIRERVLVPLEDMGRMRSNDLSGRHRNPESMAFEPSTIYFCAFVKYSTVTGEMFERRVTYQIVSDREFALVRGVNLNGEWPTRGALHYGPDENLG